MTHFSLQSFEHGASQAEEIARHLNVPYRRIAQHIFPDGESLVTAEMPTQITGLYCPLNQPNARLVELSLAVESLRRNGARRLILIAPYLCYMRQDTAFHAGEAISQRAIGRWLACMFDRIISVDAHLHRVSSLAEVFSGIEAENLSSAPCFCEFLQGQDLPASTLLVGPDRESRQWVDQIAKTLGLDVVIGKKTRLGDREISIDFGPAPFAGRPALIIDDIVSSGGTIIQTIKALKAAGASDISVALTHALFCDETLQAMRQAGAQKIWSSSSVPHTTNIISLSRLLAEALRSEMDDVKGRPCQ